MEGGRTVPRRYEWSKLLADVRKLRADSMLCLGFAPAVDMLSRFLCVFYVVRIFSCSCLLKLRSRMRFSSLRSILISIGC